MWLRMDTLTLFGTRLIVGETDPLPKPDNDNLRLMEDWMTPAELMQWIRRTRQEMRQELAADFRLRNCPTHRRHWVNLNAMERCCLWHYYGARNA
jgi:hypothetical protein